MAGFGFDDSGRPYLSPSGVQQFGFDSAGNPVIINQSNRIVFGLDSNQQAYLTASYSGKQMFGFDSNSNPVITNGNGTIFGIDSNQNPYLAPSGLQQFGFDSNANPIIGNVNYATVFGIDDGDQPYMTPSGPQLFGFNNSGEPIIVGINGYTLFGVDASGNPYLLGADGTIGFDENQQPVMISSNTNYFGFDPSGNNVIDLTGGAGYSFIGGGGSLPTFKSWQYRPGLEQQRDFDDQLNMNAASIFVAVPVYDAPHPAFFESMLRIVGNKLKACHSLSAVIQRGHRPHG